ncbi:Peptide/nickel/opine uptake family ABC transporter, permease protein [Neorhizobium galegae bv. orientalis]|nr:Peptide/nickel/opine uptake family ABC transporter, permease protein [Neorhizobium galegae bv. orientalis]
MTDVTTQVIFTKRPSQLLDVCRQFSSHRGAMAGMVILGLMLLAVIAGPWLWHVDATEIAMRARNKGPSLAHPLGTDQLGRDMLARLMAGGRVSLTVGLVAMILSLSLGTLVGICAGYIRAVDGVLMRITDLFLALPLLPLLLVTSMLFREPLSRLLGAEAGTFLLIVFVIGLTSWMHAARLVRGEVMTLKEREFILAAQSIGTRRGKMILRHILPNVLSPVLVSATLGIASAIITESSLSFLGLGFPPDFPTWGRLLYDAIDQIQIYPMRVVMPGIAISLTVLSVNYVGDGLRDAMDPRIRGN